MGASPLRDIACARRAGVGAAILVPSARTERDSGNPELTPDATVDDEFGVLELRRASGALPDSDKRARFRKLIEGNHAIAIASSPLMTAGSARPC